MDTRETTLEVALRAFVRAEFDSPTEGKRVRATIARLGLSKEEVLGDRFDPNRLWDFFLEYRGHETLFDGLDLRRLTWHWVSLSVEDLETRTLTCINHFEKKFGTRRPSLIARIMDDSMTANEVMEKVRRGLRLEPPILIGNPGRQRLVILEGHNRLLSYLRDASNAMFPVNAIVGSSPDVTRWKQW